MKKLFLAFSIVILSLFFPYNSTKAEYLVLDQVFEASCRVGVSGAKGSGICFAETDTNYFILTNAHVVGRQTSARLDFFLSGRLYGVDGTVVWKAYQDRSDVDFAVIQVAKSAFTSFPYSIRVIPLVDRNYIVKNGDYIKSGGAPGAEHIVGWEGYVTQIANTRLLYVPPPRGGCSGSGIITIYKDKNGEYQSRVVAITTWRIGDFAWDANGMDIARGGAIPISTLYKIIDGQQTNVSLLDKQKSNKQNPNEKFEPYKPYKPYKPYTIPKNYHLAATTSTQVKIVESKQYPNMYFLGIAVADNGSKYGVYAHKQTHKIHTWIPEGTVIVEWPAACPGGSCLPNLFGRRRNPGGGNGNGSPPWVDPNENPDPGNPNSPGNPDSSGNPPGNNGPSVTPPWITPPTPPTPPAVDPPEIPVPPEPTPNELELQNEINVLQAKIASLTVEKEKLTTVNGEFAAQQRVLTEAIAKKQKELEEKQKELDNLNEIVHNSNEQITTLTTNIADLIADVEVKTETVTELDSKLSEVISQKENLATQVEEASTENETLTTHRKLLGGLSGLFGGGLLLLLGRFIWKRFAGPKIGIVIDNAQNSVDQKLSDRGMSDGTIEWLRNKVDALQSQLNSVVETKLGKKKELESSTESVTVPTPTQTPLPMQHQVEVSFLNVQQEGVAIEKKVEIDKQTASPVVVDLFDHKASEGERVEDWALKAVLYKEAVALLRRGVLATDFAGGNQLLNQQKTANKLDDWVRDQFLRRTSRQELLQMGNIYHDALIGFLYQEAVDLLRKGHFNVLGGEQTAQVIEAWVQKELLQRMGVKI